MANRSLKSAVSRLTLGLGLGAGLMFGLGATANAVPYIDYTFSQYTGNTSTVVVHVEQTNATTLTFNLSQPGSTGYITNTIGEFRAFYFSVANASLLSGLTIAASNGAAITSTDISAGAVSQITGDNDTKMNGGICGGSGCTFDVGIGFGTAGYDGQSTPANYDPAYTNPIFTVSDASGLSLSSFFATTGDLFGVRLKPFAEGSSKLACTDTGPNGNCTVTSSSSGPGPNEVPEPGSLALMGAGLMALAGLGARRRARKS